ncbi:MAG: Type IV pilus assembly protein PilM [Berkelbacteria bacterium GW2011_GWA2_35_9]|uniref:Type IV pilus assembly protein PilM n=1 Tax=Berkelbacteria bacterium GW2011_GWA2_35_9 TaxID=1618333 RepID=A0A0G0D2P5_9BACT|nr:MAG: Type IV pilus assembly protein PilM [Berkelbacteria bacterium GW2011_GWA2_35_9]
MTLLTLTYSDNKLNLLYHKKDDGFVASQTELKKGIVENGIIIDPKKFSKILANSVKKNLKIRSQVIFRCAIPEEKSYIQTILIPQVPEDKVIQAIRWQSKSLLIFDVENVYFDTQIIDKTKNKLKVLVTAIHKEVIDSLVTAIKMANYQVENINSRSGALAKMFATKQHELIAISEINDKKATIVFAKNGFPRLSSEIDLTENNRPFIGKVKELIDYYSTRKETDKKINTLYLIGDVSPEAVEKWQESLKIDIKRPSFREVSKFHKIKVEDSFITNLGLEKKLAQEVNLLPQQSIKDLQKSNLFLQVKHILEFMIFLVLILLLVNIFFYLNIDNRILEAKKREATVTQASLGDKYKKEIKLLSSITEQLKDTSIKANRSDVVETILSNKSDGFNISQISILDSGGTISGSVDRREALLVFSDILEGKSLLKNIYIPVTSYEANTEAPVEIKFEIQ